MITDVKTVGEGDSLRKACKIMVDDDIGSVVVVKGGKNTKTVPVGIITEKDVLRMFAFKEAEASSPMRKLMSQPVMTISPETSLRDALFTMVRRNIRRLPVVKYGNLVGIVTDRDIYRAISKDELLLASVINDERLVKHITKLQQSWIHILDEILEKHLTDNKS
jgi:hypothetical protein